MIFSTHFNEIFILRSPKDVTSFVDEQQAILNGLHENLSKSAIADFEVSGKDDELNICQ